MKRFFFLIFTILFSTFSAVAQNNSPYCFAIRAYPQYLLINGFRLDFEKCMFNKLAIYAGPQIYSGLTNGSGSRNKKLPNPKQSMDELRNNDGIKGYGLNVGAKIYFKSLEVVEDPNEDTRFFIGADVSYHTIDVKFSDYDYYPFYVNGLRYYSYDITDKKETIQQRGLNFFIGAQQRNNRLNLECIAGLGYRDAVIPAGLDKFRNYSKYPWDYGYSKVVPYLLLSFGIYLF